jgi:hypothetical protein
MKHPLKKGDILMASWGYDQTNIDFFKVVRLVGATLVDLVPIGSKIVRSEMTADQVVPDPDNEIPAERTIFDKLRKRPKPDGTCKMMSWGCYATPWDGAARWETNPMFGH